LANVQAGYIQGSAWEYVRAGCVWESAYQIVQVDERALELVQVGEHALEIVQADEHALEIVQADEDALKIVLTGECAWEIDQAPERAWESVRAWRGHLLEKALEQVQAVVNAQVSCKMRYVQV